ncbi:MAG: GNAT family N-acetyltransferase [Parachlamydia sp.]|nr:MAG: GNAT family N-acetyltransferase [Parachlamydia sp.]
MLFPIECCQSYLSRDIMENDKLTDICMNSQRILLRNVKFEDGEMIAHLAGDFCIADMMNGAIPHPYSLNDAQLWVEKHKEDNLNSKAISWAIIEKKSRMFIGSIQLRRAEKNNVARLSYWIGKDYWGNGYASEAVGLVIDYAFNEMNLELIEADHFERNPGSGFVLKKNGFIQSGSFCKKEGLMEREEVFFCYQIDQHLYRFFLNEHKID